MATKALPVPAVQRAASSYHRRISAPGLTTTPEFISPDLWPLNSPDLNLVDYKIWGCLQERVYQKRHATSMTWNESIWLRYARSLTIPQPDAVSHHRHRVCASDTPLKWDRSGLLGGQRSGYMNSGVCWRRYSTATRARWAGAPYCCKCLDCHVIFIFVSTWF